MMSHNKNKDKKSGNKGEWSEVYVLFRLLADGQIHAANEKIERIEDMFFPIIKIIRDQEIEGAKRKCKYCPIVEKEVKKIEIYLDDELIDDKIESEEFDKNAKELLKYINAGKNSFDIPETKAFMQKIYVENIKSSSSNKTDIEMEIHDANTGHEPLVGFSIKSQLGEPSTLLNASQATNFVYRVDGPELEDWEIEKINNRRQSVKDRINRIIIGEDGKTRKLTFVDVSNETFRKNLQMIDSQMPCIVANMLINFYSKQKKILEDNAQDIKTSDPIGMNGIASTFYEYKIKEMLCAIALGMKPDTPWNGKDEASGGYIIVKKNGEVLAYHIYNRDNFKDYLFKNTKFETASKERHRYGLLYKIDNSTYIKLNLQIRFMK